jgi:hypothetical protein
VASWTTEKKQLIERWLNDDCKCCFAGINRSSGQTTHIPVEQIFGSEIIMAYSLDLDLYFVWNSYVHRLVVDKQATHTLSVPKKYVRYNDRVAIEGIEAVYQHLQGDSPNHEKYLIIEPSFLKEFCLNPFAYLMPDSQDENYKEKTRFASPSHSEPYLYRAYSNFDAALPASHEYTSCRRIKRDARFRKLVFSICDHPHCAICGIDILETLEAAHIVAVKDGGENTRENGVCLCANHHLMFDSGMFHIDPKTRKIYGIDPRLSDTIEEKYV